MHAALLIVFAYSFTTLTSVMIIEDFAIPSAVFLSIVFLKIRYRNLHYIAIAITVLGIIIGFINDFVYLKEDGGSSTSDSTFAQAMIGDVMALSGAFMFALENIL